MPKNAQTVKKDKNVTNIKKTKIKQFQSFNI